MFGTFTNGYSHAKRGSTAAFDNHPMNSVWVLSISARAAITTPIENSGYVLNVTDSSKYSIAVYDIADNTLYTSTYTFTVTGVYFQGGTNQQHGRIWILQKHPI